MKDVELHPAQSSFSSKKPVESFRRVCNVTPHEHKDETSEHFCDVAHTIQTPAAKLDSMAPIQRVRWFLAVYF